MLFCGLTGAFFTLWRKAVQPLHLFDEAEAGRSYQLHLPEKEKEQVLDLLNSLIAEEQNDTFGRQDAQKALLTLLLITLARRQKNSKRDVQSQGEEGLVPGVIRYINAHLEGDLSLDTLSQLFFISKYHLIREFKRYTNTTVYEYILLKRVVLAKKLMAQGATAEEACRGSGFSDYSNFYKTFTRRARMTPREYKNHCLNE